MADVGVAVRPDGHTARKQRRSNPAPVSARRRPVPGGRAILGGLLVAAAVVGLFSASSRAGHPPKQSWVVARRALAPGRRLTADDLGRASIDLPASLAAHAFHDSSTVVGATLVAPLSAGDLVQSSAVVAKSSAAASRELTFGVTRATLGPDLAQGERIDVLATYGTGGDAFTAVVLRQVLVVAIDRGRDGVGDSGDAAVTVAVDDPGDAVAIAHAIQEAKLTVVRATGATPIPASAPVYRQPSGVPASGGTSAAGRS